MRRILVVAAIAFVVLVGGTVAAQTVQRFSDVAPDHPQAAAIDWAADVGLTAGYGDGTFRPDVALPRWQAHIFMDRFYDQIIEADTSPHFTRGDMMTLLHTMAPATATTTTTTVAPAGVWNYGATRGEYGQEFPVAWVTSNSGRSLLIRECDWFPNNHNPWYLRFEDDDQTTWVSRLTDDQVTTLLSGSDEVIWQVWRGHAERPGPDSPWQPVNFDPTVDVFETFQITGAPQADQLVDARCEQLGWTQPGR